MATNYDLNNTGQQVQERLDQVMPNKTDIEQEALDRQAGDNALQGQINAINTEIGESGQGGETINGRLDELESAVGSGGSVDERIADAKTEIVGGASEDYDTLGKVEGELVDTYRKDETYSKKQLDSLITTPDVEYVTVTAVSTTTDVTTLLPNPGAADTIYRVGNWNGTQYDPTVYALYAWNGTSYTFLAVRTSIGEVYDISANHPDGQGNPAVYTDLANALGASGVNVPSDIRRGGMSVKFIQLIPAKYSVVVTTSDTHPTGTALSSASSVTSGTYEASALTDFSTLPSTTGSANAVVYYYTDGTTYTVWTITMASAQGSEYMQYRLMATAWSTTPSDWQGVDAGPTAGSRNLVESGGVFDELYDETYSDLSFGDNKLSSKYIQFTTGNILAASEVYNVYYWPCVKGDKFKISCNHTVSSGSASMYAIYSADSPSNFAQANCVEKSRRYSSGTYEIEIDDDNTKWVAVTQSNGYITSVKKRAYISKFDALDGDIEGLGNRVYVNETSIGTLNKKTADVIAAYDKTSLTSSGYYALNCTDLNDVTSNQNTVHNVFDIPDGAKALLISGSYSNEYPYETIVFFNEDGEKENSFYLKKTFRVLPLKSSYKKVAVSALTRSDLSPFVKILFEGMNYATTDELVEIENKEIAFQESMISRVGMSDIVYDDFQTGFFEANPSRANFGQVTVYAGFEYIKINVEAGKTYMINAKPLAPNAGWGTKNASNQVVRYGTNEIKSITIQNGETELYITNYSAYLSNPSVVLEGIKGTLQADIESELQDYKNIANSYTEVTLRKALWQQQRIAPFTWKPFVKSYFSWMNDDALASAPSYYAVCRNKRAPYCHAFIVRNPEPTFTYNGVDSERLNFIKEPVVGETYTIEIESGEYSTLCLYQDRRGNALDGGLSVTVNGSTSNVSLVSNRLSLGTVSSVSFKVNAGGSLSAGTRLKYLNIILTNSATDTESESEWSAEELLKNIVFDFGEILAHGSTVINTFDLAKGEELLAYYTYEVPRIINEMLGENHVHGLITVGGPNSDRWLNTEIGQEYMLRNMLYGDYYGTTPQYTITRSSLTSSARIIQFIVAHGTLSVDTNYTLGTSGVRVRGIDAIDASNDMVYATYNGSMPASSGNVYQYNTSTVVTTYTSLQMAEDNSTVRTIMYNNIDTLVTSLTANNGFYPFFNHEEVLPFAVDVFLEVLIDKGLYIGTWYDAYIENS